MEGGVRRSRGDVEEKPTYDEVLCDAEENQQQHQSSQSAS